jgi:hypothetical protein
VFKKFAHVARTQAVGRPSGLSGPSAVGSPRAPGRLGPRGGGPTRPTSHETHSPHHTPPHDTHTRHTTSPHHTIQYHTQHNKEDNKQTSSKVTATQNRVLRYIGCVLYISALYRHDTTKTTRPSNGSDTTQRTTLRSAASAQPPATARPPQAVGAGATLGPRGALAVH